MAYTWSLLFFRDSDTAGKSDVKYITNSDSSLQKLTQYSYTAADTYELQTGYGKIDSLDALKSNGFTRARTAGRWFNLRATLSDYYDETADTKTGDGWKLPFYYVPDTVVGNDESVTDKSVQRAINNILSDSSRAFGLRDCTIVAQDGTNYIAFTDNAYTTNNGTADTTIKYTMVFDLRYDSVRHANGISAKSSGGKTINVTKALTNCTSTDAPDTVTGGESYSFTVTANAGYEFNTAPVFNYYGGTMVVQFTQEVGTVSDDKTTASFNFTLPTIIITPCALRATADAITESSINFGIVNLYKMTVDNLRTLAAERYYLVSTDYYYSSIDLGDFITSLRRFFINVPSVRETTVKLYDKTLTDLTVGVVETVSQETKSNAITIPETFNSSFDYENADIEIYLPFHGFESLDAARVIGKEIIVDYKSDLFNGDTMITITANGEIIATYDCNVSQEIPYILTSINDAQVKQNVGANAAALGNYTMFITVRTPKAATADSVQATGATGLISTFSGYNEFENIKLSCGATQAEYNEIINELKAGVIL